MKLWPTLLGLAVLVAFSGTAQSDGGGSPCGNDGQNCPVFELSSAAFPSHIFGGSPGQYFQPAGTSQVTGPDFTLAEYVTPTPLDFQSMAVFIGSGWNSLDHPMNISLLVNGTAELTITVPAHGTGVFLATGNAQVPQEGLLTFFVNASNSQAGQEAVVVSVTVGGPTPAEDSGEG
ncbi:MAG: hypothetical protein ACYDDF_11445 [Thermoplasmatota archaeon]